MPDVARGAGEMAFSFFLCVVLLRYFGSPPPFPTTTLSTTPTSPVRSLLFLVKDFVFVFVLLELYVINVIAVL